MKNVTILGSTGSIGTNTLKVIDKFNHRFRVLGLTAHKNIKRLIYQIKKFKPSYVCVTYKKDALKLKRVFNKLTVYQGQEGLDKIASLKQNHIVVTALVGAAGLTSTLAAVKSAERVAISNKEPLVMAGPIIIKEVKKNRTELLPIDSEHNAIYQCLKGYSVKEVEKIILTASGGPFFNKKIDFNKVTVSQALNHPNWSMGKKITIDSATMMNKGLEVIEAKWLFGIEPDKISVIIHPQSIIHSMVQYRDGSIIAQLSKTDMKHPIQYALTYPCRLSSPFKKLSLTEINKLTFFKPDLKRFKCLKLAYRAIKQGGLQPAILNAANEVAVDFFLNNKLGFNLIPYVISKTMRGIKNKSNITIDTVLQIDKESRKFAGDLCAELI